MKKIEFRNEFRRIQKEEKSKNEELKPKGRMNRE